MLKIALVSLYAGANAVMLSLLGRTDSPASQLSLGLLIALSNLICGIRLGHSGGKAYLKDITRLNQFLSSQNCEVIQANRELLERISAKESSALSHRIREHRA